MFWCLGNHSSTQRGWRGVAATDEERQPWGVMCGGGGRVREGLARAHTHIRARRAREWFPPFAAWDSQPRMCACACANATARSRARSFRATRGTGGHPPRGKSQHQNPPRPTCLVVVSLRKKRKIDHKPGLTQGCCPCIIARTRPIHFPQPRSPCALHRYDSQRTTMTKSSLKKRVTVPEYGHRQLAGGSNQETRGLNSHGGVGRCGLLPRCHVRPLARMR